MQLAIQAHFIQGDGVHCEFFRPPGAWRIQGRRPAFLRLCAPFCAWARRRLCTACQSPSVATHRRKPGVAFIFVFFAFSHEKAGALQEMAHRVYLSCQNLPRRCDHFAVSQSYWVWVKIIPGSGPRVLVHASICRGKLFWDFGGYPMFDPQPHCTMVEFRLVNMYPA